MPFFCLVKAPRAIQSNPVWIYTSTEKIKTFIKKFRWHKKSTVFNKRKPLNTVQLKSSFRATIGIRKVLLDENS